MDCRDRRVPQSSVGMGEVINNSMRGSIQVMMVMQGHDRQLARWTFAQSAGCRTHQKDILPWKMASNPEPPKATVHDRRWQAASKTKESQSYSMSHLCQSLEACSRRRLGLFERVLPSRGCDGSEWWRWCVRVQRFEAWMHTTSSCLRHSQEQHAPSFRASSPIGWPGKSFHWCGTNCDLVMMTHARSWQFIEIHMPGTGQIASPRGEAWSKDCQLRCHRSLTAYYGLLSNKLISGRNKMSISWSVRFFPTSHVNSTMHQYIYVRKHD